MQIIIHDTNELSELDLRVLRALVGAEAAEAPVSGAKTAPAAEPKAAPAKPAQKAAKKPEPEPEPEEEPEDEPEVAEESEDGDEAPTLKDAVALATKLVSDGKAPQVKKALTDLGAKRVSELKESDVPAFIAALS